MSTFDTSKFDGDDIGWINFCMKCWGVQSNNAYREIVHTLLTPFEKWPIELQDFAKADTNEGFTIGVQDVQKRSKYKGTNDMVSLGRIIAQYFGHIPPPD